MGPKLNPRSPALLPEFLAKVSGVFGRIEQCSDDLYLLSEPIVLCNVN